VIELFKATTREENRKSISIPPPKKKKNQRKLSVDWIDTLAASRLYSESDFRDNSAEPSSHPYMKKRVSSLTTDRHFIYSVFLTFFPFNLVGIHQVIYLPIAVVEAM
jgi:hypothetical protein